MTRLRVLCATLAATTAVLLGACGTSEERPPVGAGPSASAGPVSVVDARGRTVTLPRPAQRVVGLEWGELEMLVSLGVMPVGAADPKGYATWVTAAKLDPSVKDVGVRGEPSVDAIVALQPDLVVMEGDGMAAAVEQLEKFVPVVVTKGSDASRNLDRMRDDLNLIATATGRTAQAAKLLADLDAAFAAGRQKLADAGVAGQYFAMADGWKQGSAINIRMFGQGALVSEVARGLGLQNAWTGKVDPAWGLGQTDVEGITSLKDKPLRFFYNASDGDDVFADGLAGNAIWTSFGFVKENRLHKLPNGIWTFGGPLSCQQYIDAIVAAYTA